MVTRSTKMFVGSLVVSTLAIAGCGGDGEADGLVPPTADEDPDLPQIEIEVAGHRRAVHLQTHGEAGDPTILVLHGSLADFRSMRLFADLAEDGYFVVLWDQRGNGLSERITDEEIGEAAVLEEIAAIKARFSPDAPVTMLGHSFGAMYSALYASRHPADVERLILLEPAGLTGEIFEATFGDVFRLNLFDPDLARTYWQNELLGPVDHAQMDYKALQLLHSGGLLDYYCDPEALPNLPVWRPGAYYDLVRNDKLQPHRAGHFEYDYARGLDTWPGAVLLVGSECSALGEAFQREHHLARFDDVQLVRVDDAGHRLMVEQPAQVLAHVRAFLAQ